MSMQRELRQNRPFSAPTQEAAVALLRTADLVRRSIAAIVEPHGITLQQYNVLRILRGAARRDCRRWRSPSAWSSRRPASPA